MSAETKAADEVEELVRQLPPHLRENFEKVDREIQEEYGITPGVTRLVRLWLACGTRTLIRREFEFAVLDVTRRGIEPHPNGEYDEDCL